MQYLRLIITIITTGILLSACDQSPAPSSKRKPRLHLVSTEVLKLESSTIKRRFNALIIAPKTIKISNQIAGTLINMPFRAGTSVKKGDILVDLDKSQTFAEHLKALANLEKATQDLNRIKKLAPKQLASAEQLSEAITDKKLAEVEVTLKAIQLNRSSIKAPFDGVISERFFEPGDTVSINTQLLTLVDKSNLIVKSAIPESFVSHASDNKKVKINIPSLSLHLDGKVKTLYPTVDTNTQQIKIEVSFNNSDINLFPGQFAELVIPFKTEEMILIPVNTVQYDTNGTWVYTLNSEHKAQQTRITTGKNLNNKIEIINGLTNGDILITKGFIGLSPGKKVTTQIKPSNKNNHAK